MIYYNQDGYWHLPFGALEVIQICISNFKLDLLLGNQNKIYTISIENDYFKHIDDRNVYVEPTDPGIINELRGKIIEGISIKKEGILQIKLSDNYILEVFPLSEFESWGIYEHIGKVPGIYIICMPGGELAVFSGSAKPT